MKNKYDVEYIDKTHTYLVNGVIVPSVSEILDRIFPKKYKGIPERILIQKANYGTIIHKYIEQYENNNITIELDFMQQASFYEYLKLKDKYSIKVLEQEKIVNYKNIYAGRFDMIAEIDNKICLCDIKTTASLDKKSLSWQLSLYKNAYGKKIDKLYAIWLPKKNKGKLIEIESKTKKEIDKMLKELEMIK